MPETRHNLVVQISDYDREIDLSLSVDFDINGSGGIENPTVKMIVTGTVWFGKCAAEFDEGENGKFIRDFIGMKYADEIRTAIAEERERERWAET